MQPGNDVAFITDKVIVRGYTIVEVNCMIFAIPKEHGAWAMLMVPLMLGAVLNGITWLHLPLFIAVLFFYLSSFSLLMIVRNKTLSGFYQKWLLIYLLLALGMAAIPLYYYPQLVLLAVFLLPCLGLNLYFARIRRERSLMNDFIAIAGLSVGAVASGYLGYGSWTGELLLVWLLCVLFFMGSVFFVKSMLREKNNRGFRYLSWVYHLVVVTVVYLNLGILASSAFLPSLLRALTLVGRTLTPVQIGLVEIVNSLFFTIMVVALLK